MQNQKQELDCCKDENALRAGVIGLGMIGGGVAVSLANRHRIPSVFDVRHDASDGLKGVPKPISSPAEVAATK